MNEHLGSYPEPGSDDRSEFRSGSEGHGSEPEIEPAQPTGGVLEDMLDGDDRLMAATYLIDKALSARDTAEQIRIDNGNTHSGLPHEQHVAYDNANEFFGTVNQLNGLKLKHEKMLRDVANASFFRRKLTEFKIACEKALFGG